MQGIIVPGGLLILAVSFTVAWWTGSRHRYLLLLSAAYILLAAGFGLMMLRVRFDCNAIILLANALFVACQVLLGEGLLERRGKGFGFAGNLLAFAAIFGLYTFAFFFGTLVLRTVVVNTGLFIYMLIVAVSLWVRRSDSIHDKLIFVTIVMLGLMHTVRTFGLLFTEDIVAPTSIFWQFMQVYVLLLAMVLALEVLAAHFVESLERLNLMRDRDHLTGVLNRAGFDRAVSAFYGERTDTVVSLTLLDIDHFKEINDSRGHPEGDRVLVMFGHILLRETRATDIVGRIGGDEFAVLSVGLSNHGAAAMAGRISDHFRGASAQGEDAGPAYTCSVGVATLRVERGYESLYALADGALYKAKRGGRDRVVSGNPAEVEA